MGKKSSEWIVGVFLTSILVVYVLTAVLMIWLIGWAFYDSNGYRFWLTLLIAGWAAIGVSVVGFIAWAAGDPRRRWKEHQAELGALPEERADE